MAKAYAHTHTYTHLLPLPTSNAAGYTTKKKTLKHRMKSG